MSPCKSVDLSRTAVSAGKLFLTQVEEINLEIMNIQGDFVKILCKRRQFLGSRGLNPRGWEVLLRRLVLPEDRPVCVGPLSGVKCDTSEYRLALWLPISTTVSQPPPW